jgi:hypothetical protein
MPSILIAEAVDTSPRGKPRYKVIHLLNWASADFTLSVDGQRLAAAFGLGGRRVSVALLVGYLIAGWCGTRGPRPPIPPQPPDPDPWSRYLIDGVIGALGGLVGGFLFASLFGIDVATDVGVLIGVAGAFFGGRILSDLARLAMPNRMG